MLLKRPPCGQFGDVLGDGWVGEDDALAVAQYLAKTRILNTDQKFRGNVTLSGKLSTIDALRISQYVRGTINTFEACMGGEKPWLNPPPIVQPPPILPRPSINWGAIALLGLVGLALSRRR